MDYRAVISRTIEQRGPSLPAQLAKTVGKDSILTGAMLSEMSSKGLLRISHMKIGGSPLYYLPNQEEQLQQFMHHLSDKESAVLNKLKEHLILEDATLEPVERVMLKSLKDFAVSVIVKTDEFEKKFWKWYMFPDEDAKKKIVDLLTPKKEVDKEEITVARESRTQDNQKTKTKEDAQKEEAKSPSKEVSPKEQKGHTPVKGSQGEQKNQKSSETSPAELPQESKETFKNKDEENAEKKSTKALKKPKEKDEQQKIVEKTDDEKTIQAEVSQEGIGKKLLRFFEEAHIRVIANNSDADSKKRELIIEADTAIGTQRLCCIALRKKRVTDADLNSAVVRASKHNLPLLFVVDGELSKSLSTKIKKEYPGVVIRVV